ncbi:hypothetical protein CPC08DRAFT_731239 [Agrocybe pediades]|nr:hypothetical protein CPC08DRAFT_731239 [Agrocybe pediades]
MVSKSKCDKPTRHFPTESQVRDEPLNSVGHYIETDIDSKQGERTKNKNKPSNFLTLQARIGTHTQTLSHTTSGRATPVGSENAVACWVYGSGREWLTCLSSVKLVRVRVSPPFLRLVSRLAVLSSCHRHIVVSIVRVGTSWAVVTSRFVARVVRGMEAGDENVEKE